MRGTIDGAQTLAHRQRKVCAGSGPVAAVASYKLISSGSEYGYYRSKEPPRPLTKPGVEDGLHSTLLTER